MFNHYPTYSIRSTKTPPPVDGPFYGGIWDRADEAVLEHFREESSNHRPLTRVKMLYDITSLYGLFEVDDCWVRCVHTGFQVPVCKDSCVEFFVQPLKDGGYFNFEFNCGGAMLCYYILNHNRSDGVFKEFVRIPANRFDRIHIYHSMPEKTEVEIEERVVWRLGFVIPLNFFNAYTGPLTPQKKERWRANFFKCGDMTSHPHWASWSMVRELNFHAPECFGILEFA